MRNNLCSRLIFHEITLGVDLQTQGAHTGCRFLIREVSLFEGRRTVRNLGTRFMLTLGLCLFLTAFSALAGAITLDLIPIGGNLVGPPGSVVGWGYTITNDNATDWIQSGNLSADVFQNGMPNIIFDFPDIAPMSSVTQNFSLAVTGSCSSPPCGLFDLTWDSTAPVGFVNSGKFIVSSEFFDRNPGDLGAIDLGPAPDAVAGYSATVSAPVSPAPEPSMFLLLFTGLAALAFRVLARS
jgi:hypothetical protein